MADPNTPLMFTALSAIRRPFLGGIMAAGGLIAISPTLFLVALGLGAGPVLIWSIVRLSNGRDRRHETPLDPMSRIDYNSASPS